MQTDLTSIPQEQLIYVHYRETFHLNDLQNAFVETMEAIVALSAQKVLTDFRQLKGSFSTMDRFHYAEFGVRTFAKYLDCGVPPFMPLAFIAQPPILDAQKFAETVALNRGLNVRVFLDVQTAVRWLKIDHTCLPDVALI